jgi:uncharacterized membrane protein YeiH
MRLRVQVSTTPLSVTTVVLIAIGVVVFCVIFIIIAALMFRAGECVVARSALTACTGACVRDPCRTHCAVSGAVEEQVLSQQARS